MIILELVWRMFRWIATGLVVLAIGVVFLAGSPLVTPHLGSRRLS